MRMGSFHTVCTFTAAIGYLRLGDAGVADTLIEMVLLALILLLGNKRKAELSVHIR